MCLLLSEVLDGKEKGATSCRASVKIHQTANCSTSMALGRPVGHFHKARRCIVIGIGNLTDENASRRRCIHRAVESGQHGKAGEKFQKWPLGITSRIYNNRFRRMSKEKYSKFLFELIMFDWSLLNHLPGTKYKYDFRLDLLLASESTKLAVRVSVFNQITRELYIIGHRCLIDGKKTSSYSRSTASQIWMQRVVPSRKIYHQTIIRGCCGNAVPVQKDSPRNHHFPK